MRIIIICKQMRMRMIKEIITMMLMEVVMVMIDVDRGHSPTSWPESLVNPMLTVFEGLVST